MKSIVLNQEKTIKQKLCGGVFVLFSTLVFIQGGDFILFFLFILIGLFFFGFNVKIKIEHLFENSERQFCVFNFKVFTLKPDFPYPYYVSLFSTTFKGSNEFGTVSSLGRASRHDKIIIKRFKGNRNISIYKGESYKKTLNRANFVKDILNIELYNSVEVHE